MKKIILILITGFILCSFGIVYAQGRGAIAISETGGPRYYATELEWPVGSTTNLGNRKWQVNFDIAAGWSYADPNKISLIDSTDIIGIGTATPSAKLDIHPHAAEIVGLNIDAYTGHTANLFRVRDPNDVDLVRVTSGGKLQVEKGIRTSANDWGDGLSTWAHGKFVAEHSYSGNGNFDATGNAAGEKYFSDATNTPFTQADADNHNWIVISSGTFKGAKAEIIEYISTTGVIIHAHGTCWDEDLSSVDYKIYPAPQFIASDCYDTHIHVNGDGQFHVENSGGAYTGHSMIDLSGEIGADNSDTLHIHHYAEGFNNSDAFHIFYETGDLQAADETQCQQISIDETGATDGHIDGLFIETTDTSSATKDAIHISVGFDNAIEVSGGAAIDPDYGYELSTGGTVATDRVKGGAGDGNAFLVAGNDLTIFDAENDWILIGNDDIFEVLQVVLATTSSKDCELEFYYTSDGVGTWTVLPGVDDGTQGFTRSGLIDWEAPVGWAEDDETNDGDAITEGYYIGIKRTYAFNIPTEPVEDYFKIYLEQGGESGMKITGRGILKLPVLTDNPNAVYGIPLENGMIWAESLAFHCYINDTEYTLDMTGI